MIPLRRTRLGDAYGFAEISFQIRGFADWERFAPGVPRQVNAAPLQDHLHIVPRVWRQANQTAAILAIAVIVK